MEMSVVETKRVLSLEELESQTALELPDRQLMLVTVVIANVLNNLSIEVDVRNIAVAVQVCAIVQDVNAILVDDEGDAVARLTCTIQQGSGTPGGRP
jgi:hypothetical protein